MTKISPIAQFLRENHAIPKHDKNGCHFISPEGLYLGRLTKGVVNNYKVISLETFGEGLKKLYTKSIAYGQQYAYVKNISANLGVSLVPVKTYMRQVFVNFVDGNSFLKDTERNLCNKLELLATDEKTGVGLFDTDKPFIYKNFVSKSEAKALKHPQFVHTIN